MPEVVTETEIALYSASPTPTPSAPSPASFLPQPPPPVSLRDVLRILRRRALLAFVTFAVVVGAAFYATSQMKTVYEAKARILLDNPSSSSAGAGGLLSLLNLGGSGVQANGLEVEIEKIRSRDFLSEVINKAKLKDTNPEELRSRLVLSSGPGGQILDISARAKTAEEAQRIANMTAAVYKSYALAEFNDRTELSRVRLKFASAKALKEKNQAEDKLNDFIRRVGLAEPGYYYEEQAKKTVEVKAALDTAQRSLPVKEKELTFRQEQVKSIPDTVITNYPLNKNEVIDRYASQVTELQAKRNLLLLDYQPASDEVMQVDENIKILRERIKAAEKNAYTVGTKGVSRNPDYSKAQSAVYDAAFDARMTRQKIAASTKQLETLVERQKRLAVQKTEYERLRRDAEAARVAFNTTNDSILRVDVTKPTSVPSIRTLDKAQLPFAPVSPKPVLNAILAVFAGLFLAVGMALLAEYMASGSMVEEEDLYQLPELPLAGGVPLLGSVPLALPAPSGGETALPALVAENGSASGQATEDILRQIGYTVAHRHPRDPVPVVLLAGTRTDEATAALSAQLTATLVRDGLRVTLVDADRLHPRLNRVFGAPDAPGMADVLAGRRRVRDILHIGADGSLRFLSAGAPDDKTLLTEKGLKSLFKELANPAETDVVLVSGPTVWGLPAIVPLEKAASGMVLVTGPEAPAGESVSRVRRMLTNGYKPRILGVVIGDRSLAGNGNAGYPAVVKNDTEGVNS